MSKSKPGEETISESQNREPEKSPTEPNDSILGIVIAHYGDQYGILPLIDKKVSAGMEPRRGILPGRFLMLPPMEWEELMQGGQVMPAVGDLVEVRPVDDMALIERVLPRRSLLSRKESGQSYSSQIIASNVDLIWIVMPADRPLSQGGILRYLSFAGNTPVRLVITKCDLDPERAHELQKEARQYLSPDFIHLVTVASGKPDLQSQSISLANEALLPVLKELTATGSDGPPIALVCFVGPSGAGKSTLVNALLGREIQETSHTSEATGKGRHTTVRRDWILHPDGFGILDTPGMRELGLDHIDSGGPFAEIEQIAEQCRFRDCNHSGEDGCAVEQAVVEGRIPGTLLDQYRNLRQEVAIVEEFRKKRKKAVADESKEALRQRKDQWMKEIQKEFRKRPKKGR